MQVFLDWIGKISGWIWGPPMLILLVGGGIWLTIALGFFQIRYAGYILSQTFGKMFSKNVEGEGTVTPFQAVTAALASTVGASNIVGVPVAIAFGGPGAVFWMWLTAIVGSASKFTEIVLGLKYREKNEEGEYVGGPMYYLRKGLGSPFLAGLFAFFLMVELVPSIMVQANAVVGPAQQAFNISPLIIGIVVAVLVGLVVYGGIKRIARVTEFLVPFMAGLYLIGAWVIILLNITEIPVAIVLIFENAFTPAAPAGGFAGAAVAQALRWGVARGSYSNEAGMGTAPIAHSAATVDHPVRQGFWGIFEVIVDTLIICTTTAFLVLTTGLWKEVDPNAANTIPTIAFQNLLGNTLGGLVVTISILTFVISTIIVVVFYGEKQAEYLFGTKFSKVMRAIYVIGIVVGSVGGLKALWQFLDIMLATIILPNMIGLILMSGQVRELKNEFFSSAKYYPKARKR
jgi:AGCS family alanine or glycine:cation symporter